MVDQWASFPEESFAEGIPFAVGDTPVGVAVVVLSFLRVWWWSMHTRVWHLAWRWLLYADIHVNIGLLGWWHWLTSLRH